MTVLMALIGGTIARIPSMVIHGRRLKVALWKVLPLTIVFTLFELAGTMILFAVENGFLGGMSYYGGILLMPIFCVIISLIFRIPYFNLTDIFATAAGGMLAVMRIQCLINDCCKGIVLFSSDSITIRFPSRTFEMVTVLSIMTFLLVIGKNEKFKGKLYPIYLICYGVIRFTINWFREGITPFIGMLPPGNFWSLVAIALGIIWILLYNKFYKREKPAAQLQ